ncbi:MerR family DNA-binding protein [Streptacidiphilus griseoplanus]|uniref:MerR family DNA-binding protein n=1 Tax=Peterkaempfera griseoplana TaxID=66896 RepID=UPI0006E41C0C|nr:MerR family DNA-binding protein [Peterkaempfera griseoplana]
MEWLNDRVKFRTAGMPLATIRRYAELVRYGPGDEGERLALLSRHRQRVIDRIAELTECLDLITHNAGIYQEHIAQGAASDPWSSGSGPLGQGR